MLFCFFVRPGWGSHWLALSALACCFPIVPYGLVRFLKSGSSTASDTNRDYLLERGCATGRIGVLGASAGAAAALDAATQDAVIGAVIADSARVEPGVISLAARPRHAPRRVPWGRLLAALGSAPGADVGRLRGRPVLVIHGDNDPVVPVAHGLALAQATQSRLWVTASRSHAGSLRDDPGTYCAVVLRFFTHHLLGDGVPLACDRGPGVAPQPGAGPLF